jgi:hypothetical protein
LVVARGGVGISDFEKSTRRGKIGPGKGAKGEPSQGSPFFFAAVTPLFAGPAAILSLRRPAKAAYLGPSLV